MAQGFHDDTSEVRPLKTVRECRDSDGFLTLDRRETNDPMRLFPQIIDTLNHSFSNYQQTYLSGHRELLFTAIEALLSGTPGSVTAIPFQPGLGKSTIIRAFLEVTAKEFAMHSSISTRLGGIVVVVEKTSEAEELENLCNQHSRSEPLAHVLSSPNDYHLQKGRCPTGEATTYRECHRQSCSYAKDCPLLQAVQKIHETPILIMLHARYVWYMEDMTELLPWTNQAGDLFTRSLLLVDELPNFFDEITLDIAHISQLECDLDSQKKSCHPAIKREKSHLLSRWNYSIRRPFYNLLHKLAFSKESCGLITWGSLSQAGFDSTELQSLEDQLIAYLQDERHEAIRTVHTLIHNTNFFYFSGQSDSLFLPRLRHLAGKGQPATFLFSGTASLSPEISRNPEIRVMEEEKLESFSRLKIHIQRSDVFNISKTALTKPHNRAGLLEWARHMLEQLKPRHRKILVVTYKAYSVEFWQALASFHDVLVPYISDQGDSLEMLPYFGGMTGSNLYRECTCLLVLGLNRFEPKDYISRTLALDTSSALSQRLLSALEAGITPPSLFSCSEVLETQDMVLAQDLVQLMFRTALRNHGGNEEIEVWLLQPPNGVLHFLEVYFGDCVIDESRELPESCKQAVTMNRVYTGNPTHAAQLLRFLHHWSGDSGLTPQDIREATGLSPSQFKEAKKNKDVRAYFTQNIVTKGSGRNTIYYKKNSEILRNTSNT